MKFTVSIIVDNAAFGDDDDDYRNHEVARILGVIAEQVAHGVPYGGVRDINGNPVGEFAYANNTN